MRQALQEKLQKIEQDYLSKLPVDSPAYEKFNKIANMIKQEIKKEHKREIDAYLASLNYAFTENVSDDKKALISDVYPMSEIQKGLVYTSLIHPEKSVYHEQFNYQLRIPQFSSENFKEAVRLMVEKHEMLRTAFVFDGTDEPLQIVYASAPLMIDIEDIRSLPPHEQETLISSDLEMDRSQPFQLDRAPVWRIKLFLTADDHLCFSWRTHHVLSDGWSNASWVMELFQTYFVLSQNVVPALQPLKSSYKDYIKEQLLLQKNEDVKTFWKTELAEAKPYELGLDTNGASETEYVESKFSKDVVQKLQAFAKQSKVHPKSICFAAYVYTLSLFSYENDFVVGLVENNRPICEDAEKILGCFLNTIPFRYIAEKNIAGQELIAQIDAKLKQMKHMGRLPLNEILNASGREGAEEKPLFELIFNFVDFHVYQSEETKQILDERLNIHQRHERTNTAFDVTVSTTLNELVIYLETTQNFMRKDQLLLFAKTFKTVLMHIIESSDLELKKSEIGRSISTLSHLKAEALYRETDKTFLTYYNECVQKDPNRIAIQYQSNTLTYKQLDEQSSKIAAEIRTRQEIKPNDIIAVYSEKSDECLISLLGILKSGAAYLPIDISTPTDRIDFILKDSQAKLVLCSNVLMTHLQEKKDKWVTYSELISSEKSSSDFVPIVQPESLAYVIYTSGTTGQPKGVMIDHQSLIARLVTEKELYGLNASLKTLQLTNYAFDVSLLEIFLPLHCGGSIVVPEHKDIVDPDYLVQLTSQLGVTALQGTPSFIELLLSAVTETSGIHQSLKHLFIGGESLSQGLLRRIRTQLPHVQVNNHYGPTETAIDAIIHPNVVGIERDIIGLPIPGTESFILDQDGECLAQGVKGEICIGGQGISVGYLHRKDLTDKVFLNHPEFNLRLYRTGDFGRVLDEGQIEFLGRIDHQVKVRGYRTELQEVDHHIRNYSEISEVYVTSRQVSENDNELIGFIKLTSKGSIEALKAFLSDRLAPYMIPSRWVEVTEFPLTSNGKINRTDLLVNIKDRADIDERYVAPENSTEEKLALLWSEILDVSTVGIDTSFFDLGGTSLKLLKLHQSLQTKFQTTLSIADLFSLNTIRKLAAYLEPKEEIANEELETFSFTD